VRGGIILWYPRPGEALLTLFARICGATPDPASLAEGVGRWYGRISMAAATGGTVEV